MTNKSYSGFLGGDCARLLFQILFVSLIFIYIEAYIGIITLATLHRSEVIYCEFKWMDVAIFNLSTRNVKRQTRSSLNINPPANFSGLNPIQSYLRNVQTRRVELDQVEPLVKPKPTLVLCLNDIMIYRNIQLPEYSY